MDDVSVDTRVCAASTLMNPERVVDDAEPVAYSIDELVPSLTCAGVVQGFVVRVSGCRIAGPLTSTYVRSPSYDCRRCHCHWRMEMSSGTRSHDRISRGCSPEAHLDQRLLPCVQAEGVRSDHPRATSNGSGCVYDLRLVVLE